VRAARLSGPGHEKGDGPQAVSIPGYELGPVIGSGGMGVVYRARDRAFDRDVAVKLLQDRYPSGSPVARRFLDEARITGQLQHPAIPPVHQLGTLPDGRPFLVMKLIKGDTLADLLAAAPGDRGRFVAVFAQVCQAVAYAHARKVIHRDLKPANVMVGAFGEVQVMDWGLAKVLGAADEKPEADGGGERTAIRSLRGEDSATQAGSVMGTPAYMSPEQAGGEVELVDERADVFGLGAILCVILTGKPPYTGSSAGAVQVQAIRGDLGATSARLDACGADPELVAICKRCLARDREARPRDAGELAGAVTAHLAAAEVRARQAELDRVRSDRDKAIQLKELADRARAEAERLRGLAEEAQKEVERERKKLAVFAYGRTLQVAHQEWRDNNIAAARTLLDGTRKDLRGWEWHYVHRLCHADLLTLTGHESWVFCAAFSLDGSRIVTASGDGTAKVWDATTGTVLFTIDGHKEVVNAAAFSPDGARIVTASADKTARLWDAVCGKEVGALVGHTDRVYCAAFSPDGRRVVTGCADGTARVWDTDTGTALLTLAGHANWESALSFGSDGAELLTILGHANHVNTVSFSPDGSRIATASSDKTARIWDAATGAELVVLRGHANYVNAAAFSPDGSRVATASTDGTARVWDAKTGKARLALRGHTDAVFFVTFSPDGTRIATGGRDQTARVWDAKTGAELLALRGHADWVRSAAFSSPLKKATFRRDLRSAE